MFMFTRSDSVEIPLLPTHTAYVKASELVLRVLRISKFYLPLKML